MSATTQTSIVQRRGNSGSARTPSFRQSNPSWCEVTREGQRHGKRPRSHDARRSLRGNQAQVCSEFIALWKEHGRKAMRGERGISYKTMYERKKACLLFLKQLYERGMRIRHLKNLERRHIEALVQTWTENKYGGTTLRTYWAFLKWMVSYLAQQDPSKKRLMDDMSSFFSDPSVLTVITDGSVDRGLSAKELTGEVLYDKVFKEDPRVAVCVALGAHFAMRIKESFLFRPHVHWDGGSSPVHIIKGTKGGRPRVYSSPLTAGDKYLLELARTFCVSECDSMVPAGVSLKKWTSHARYVLRKVGITKKDLGVTFHSLRHERFHGIYRDRTGKEPPVRGGQSDVPALLDESARAQVSADAGHHRLSITVHYLGSSPKKKKKLPCADQDTSSELAGSRDPEEQVATDEEQSADDSERDHSV
jgi:Phage integrase, N-terminal/Integrase